MDLLLRKKKDLSSVKAFFNTHLHGDHILGAVSMFSLFESDYKDTDMDVFLPDEKSKNALVEFIRTVENVELPLIYRGIGKQERRKLAKEALEMVGLGQRMDHKPSEMSGGQQQRVAIARAIAAKPPVILADEPTGNLDSASSKEILQILKDLHSGGRTVILITHDDGIAEQAYRIIRILDGKIESDWKNNKILESREEIK